MCPVGHDAGIPKLPLEIQVLWPDQDLLRTAGMNPQDYRCNQAPGQNLIRCTFATLLFPVPLVFAGWRQNLAECHSSVVQLLFHWWDQAGLQLILHPWKWIVCITQKWHFEYPGYSAREVGAFCCVNYKNE